MTQRTSSICIFKINEISLTVDMNRLPLKVLIYKFEPRHGIFNNVVRATSKGSDQPVHTRRLTRAFSSRLNNT